jgi:polyisoprenoid-binding protein YceI
VANWKIDPARTHIAFAIDAVAIRTQGEFQRLNGRISVGLEHTGRSSVAFQVQSQSVDVGSSSLYDYLCLVAFLDAARNPTIDFVSNWVDKIDDHTVRVSAI